MAIGFRQLSFESLRTRAQELRLHGLLAQGPEVAQELWVAPLVQWEEDERARRSLERRIKEPHLGGFKALRLRLDLAVKV
ncbi:hypothetical protein [Paraburkholderia youngii]|uniref:Uncharacterized protein n=1 Tax=Paraburkholderia youngii TaxID=2782701 RepID=A0A7Y6K7X9_9BURK|nr:hypothetical protein [Paraburkholderia youngii]NUY06067.1 hypothetical protein [Paraburkholderia youngii]